MAAARKSYYDCRLLKRNVIFFKIYLGMITLIFFSGFTTGNFLVNIYILLLPLNS